MKTILALTAALALAVPAIAQPKSGSWQVGNDSFHIYYADLDMKSVAGRAALLMRVHQAADRLCDTSNANDQRTCVADTIAQLANADIKRALADRVAVQLAGR